MSEAATPPSPSSALVPKKPLAMRFGKWLQPRVNAIVARTSKIGDHPFYDKARFSWIAELEANWQAIAAEAAAVYAELDKVPPLAAISPDHRRIAPAGKWRSFFLYGYGYRVPANCAKCPQTAALARKIPGLNSALFSILAPGTHIPAHTGVSKLILTCHLGLRVPQAAERCRMRVGDEIVHWHEGQALLFDDMYNHEVWNDTDELRVVLLIQFRRPLRLVGKIVGNWFVWAVRHSRFVQDARRGVERWQPDQEPPEAA